MSRREVGTRRHAEIMGFEARDPHETPFAAATVDTVFGELWSRGVLSERDRRLVTLAAIGSAGATALAPHHLRAALRSGALSADDLNEFILHFAFYAGWPRAAALSVALRDVLAEFEDDRP